MPDGTTETASISESDFGHWRLLHSFRKHLESVFGSHPLGPSWEDPKRELQAADYLSLFLFGLLNPVAQTLRGLCEASQFKRVQKEVCARRVPRSTFSDAQHVLDPILLEKVFSDLSAQIPSAPQQEQIGKWQWLAQDGSLFRALPRMAWAIYGGGNAGSPNRAARLHLSLNVFEDKPVQATLRPGRQCERAVWEEKLQAGAGYIADRYFGESYQLFGRLAKKGCVFVIRIRNKTTINVEEELPLSQADRAQGVVRQAWVTLGGRYRPRSMRLRLVWIPTQKEDLILATNLSMEQMPAELVSQLYRKRWRVELFFRWIKCILRCGHWMAESHRGATIQIYLALIASLFLQLYTGRRPSKRMMEVFELYQMGWVTQDEMLQALQRCRQELDRRKKS